MPLATFFPTATVPLDYHSDVRLHDNTQHVANNVSGPDCALEIRFVCIVQTRLPTMRLRAAGAQNTTIMNTARNCTNATCPSKSATTVARTTPDIRCRTSNVRCQRRTSDDGRLTSDVGLPIARPFPQRPTPDVRRRTPNVRCQRRTSDV